MISISKNTNGLYTVSAMVVDGQYAFLTWQAYNGYNKREMLKMFRAYLKENNYKLAK